MSLIIFVSYWGMTKVVCPLYIYKFLFQGILKQYYLYVPNICGQVANHVYVHKSAHHILVRLQDHCTKFDWMEFPSQDWFSECNQIVTSSISSQSNIADSYHQHYFSQSHTAVYVSVLCTVLQLTVFTSTACCVLFVRLTVWCSTYKCTIVHLLTH